MSPMKQTVEVSMSRRWAGGATLLMATLAVACGDSTDAVTENMAILPVADQRVVVGAELQVQFTVTNTAAITPEFRISDSTLAGLATRTSRPTFVPFGAGSIMRWTPLITDVGSHTIEVEALTAKAAAVTTFQVVVEPGQAAPVFRQPLGSGPLL